MMQIIVPKIGEGCAYDHMSSIRTVALAGGNVSSSVRTLSLTRSRFKA